MIYLDNAATTKIHPDVLDAMMPFLTEQYGNAGTIYELGRISAEAIQNARQYVALVLGALPEQIVFTSGGSEANNMVFQGVKDYLKQQGKTRILISNIEHDSVIKSAQKLIKDGFDIHYAPCSRTGQVNIGYIRDFIACHNDVGLISIMHTNNEIGSVNNVCAIGEICRENGVLFHTDCVQALGTHELRVDDIKCDFLSVSGHKVHAPKGIGALYIRSAENFQPMICGGDTQEFGLRGGTENVANIVGFGKACEMMYNDFRLFSDSANFYRQAFLEKLNAVFDKNGIRPILHYNCWLRYSQNHKIVNLRFDGVDAETLVLMLDSRGICVSAGSACRSHESKPSRVLTGIGLSDEEARESIRISFSMMNTDSEAHHAAIEIADCVKTLLQGVD